MLAEAINAATEHHETWQELIRDPDHLLFELISGSVTDLVFLAVGAFLVRPLWDRAHKKFDRDHKISHEVTQTEDTQ